MFKVGDKVKLIREDIEGDTNGFIYTVNYIDEVGQYIRIRQDGRLILAKCFVLAKKKIEEFGISKFINSLNKREVVKC